MNNFYSDTSAKLLFGDTFEIMQKLPSNSFDMIFADPPYFLSNGGISCSGGKQVSVNKGAWDEGLEFDEKYNFNRRWIHECKRLLTINGTLWISGTFHNIYCCGLALEQEGFRILNNITWKKLNPPPNLSCRTFTHSTETILWARKNEKHVKHYFNYSLMKEINNGKQMKDVWEGSLTPQSEKKYGKHPTQKPIYLLERIIQASTKKGDNVLDPFVGSGTTCVAAKILGRNSVGIDNSLEYLTIARERLENTEESDS
jgi:DNA (cytosine-5-)-methyltransferase